MMPYSVLSYTDFYGSILSFWVTLVSMARLPSEKAKSFLFMLAALAIALGVQWNKHNLWVQLVPILASVGIMGCSWVTAYTLLGLHVFLRELGFSDILVLVNEICDLTLA